MPLMLWSVIWLVLYLILWVWVGPMTRTVQSLKVLVVMVLGICCIFSLHVKSNIMKLVHIFLIHINAFRSKWNHCPYLSTWKNIIKKLFTYRVQFALLSSELAVTTITAKISEKNPWCNCKDFILRLAHTNIISILQVLIFKSIIVNNNNITVHYYTMYMYIN